eukprot:6922362-Lingulodinium_polyedra.AAC.1
MALFITLSHCTSNCGCNGKRAACTLPSTADLVCKAPQLATPGQPRRANLPTRRTHSTHGLNL